MRFLDDMTPEEKEHLEEALQRWKRAEDKVSHRVQMEYAERFTEFANADHNLWRALQRIQARQLQEQMAERQDRRAMVLAVWAARGVSHKAAEHLKEGTLVVLNKDGEVQAALPNIDEGR